MTVQRVRPGDRFGMSAGVFNALAGAANRVHATPTQLGGPQPIVLATTPAVVAIRNAGEAAIPRWGVVELAAPSVLPSASLEEWGRRVLVDGATPGADAGDDSWIGIAPAPIRPGAVGRVVVDGVTHALIDVSDAGHARATVVEDGAKLVSSQTGPHQILWKESGTGEKRALVRIATPTGGTSGGVYAATITGVDGSVNATYDAVACLDESVEVLDAAPINRPLDPDEFDWQAAEVGDPCLIWECPAGETVLRRLIVFEQVLSTDCEGEEEPEALFALAAPPASEDGTILSSSTTETPLDESSIEIGAGLNAVGRAVRCTFGGVVQSAGSSAVLTLRLRIGGTTVATWTQTFAAAQATTDWVLCVVIVTRADGASGQVLVQTVSAQFGARVFDIGSQSPTTVDLTGGSTTIDLSAQWSASSSTNRIGIRTAICEEMH